ncbi:hypothetical protein C7974DRAFT_156121 [Boeremia exigua]|uniref:uncharacterized protein n=1 Tax=Boeremia exigua TaxID=749465 RepID=UPI001E8E58BD|nr:uncharacterized protein C7974DRAFT_156121 [Boeremia exigua]KAH6638204.1 hypothetical protein C7974DRAFT_156121 [Boeremia exigua]
MGWMCAYLTAGCLPSVAWSSWKQRLGTAETTGRDATEKLWQSLGKILSGRTCINQTNVTMEPERAQETDAVERQLISESYCWCWRCAEFRIRHPYNWIVVTT